MSKTEKSNTPGEKKRGRRSQAEKDQSNQTTLGLGGNGNNSEEHFRDCEIEHTNKFPYCQQGCPLPACNGVEVPGAPGADPDPTGPGTTKDGQLITKPLTVEVHFPTITDLKQVVTIDKGSLILGISFKVKLENGFELFRLSNMLKQQGAGIFATLGSKQVAMDFVYNKDEQSIEIIKPEEVAVSSPDEEDNTESLCGEL